MGAAFDSVDVVDVGVEVFAVRGVVHDGYLDGHVVLLGLDIDDVVEEMGA